MSVKSAPGGEPHAAIDLLEALIRRRSVTPDDAGCQALLRTRLEPLGFRCDALPFGPVENLWARRGDAGPLLCFAGHTDVVPPGDDAAWASPPFEPVRRDGLLYGRGAADMKGGLAAMVVAVEQFLARHPRHDGSIALLITSDEEGRARDGTRKVIETLSARGQKIDMCVLGEPSSEKIIGDTIRIGRRGSLSGRLTVKGLQGHVAYPALADNPITRFAPVLAELCGTEWDLGNSHFPPTSFQIVELSSSGGAPNVTPGELHARFNFRYCTIWDHGRLQSAVDAILQRHGIDYELHWHLSGEPFLTPPGKLTTAVAQAVAEVTGREPELSTAGGTSDGRFISPAGADVVELGPVNASIHQVNEHVRLADIPALCTMYRRILELLLVEQPAQRT